MLLSSVADTGLECREAAMSYSGRWSLRRVLIPYCLLLAGRLVSSVSWFQAGLLNLLTGRLGELFPFSTSCGVYPFLGIAGEFRLGQWLHYIFRSLPFPLKVTLERPIDLMC